MLRRETCAQTSIPHWCIQSQTSPWEGPLRGSRKQPISPKTWHLLRKGSRSNQYQPHSLKFCVSPSTKKVSLLFDFPSYLQGGGTECYHLEYFVTTFSSAYCTQYTALGSIRHASFCSLGYVVFFHIFVFAKKIL